CGREFRGLCDCGVDSSPRGRMHLIRERPFLPFGPRLETECLGERQKKLLIGRELLCRRRGYCRRLQRAIRKECDVQPADIGDVFGASERSIHRACIVRGTPASPRRLKNSEYSFLAMLVFAPLARASGLVFHPLVIPKAWGRFPCYGVRR